MCLFVLVNCLLNTFTVCVGEVIVFSLKVIVVKCEALWLVSLCYKLYQRSTDLCDHQCMSESVRSHHL